MAQQPTVVRRGPALALNVGGWRLFCLIVAVVMFVILAIIDLGDATLKWSPALLPGGLAFFAAAHL